MREKDIFAVAERWYEHRTPSGRWSKVKEDYRICLFNREQFNRFLAERWRDERRTGYRYTMHGYFPSRVSVPNPYASYRSAYRSVTEFTFSDDSRFTDLLLDAHEEAN